MPTGSEVPSASRGTSDDRVSGSARRSQARPRLTSPRSFADGISAPLRRVCGEAAARASVALATTADRGAEEIEAVLLGLLADLPDLGARQEDAPANDRARDLPRRYIDVLRGELLAELVSSQDVVDGSEAVWVLAALEEMGRRCELTSAGRFVARLSGAEAVNAVVEIAHDIRSPLSSILFLVDTIRRGQSGKVSPVQERQLGLIYGAALGLSTLSSDLIDAVRGQRLVDGRPVPFSVAEIMLGVYAIVEPIREEKGLPLHVRLPQVDGRLGYPSAINRVLLNLTTNALRYTETGSVSIGCTEDSDHEVEFWIKDTGRGIPDNVLGMLFDGFRPGSVGMRFSSAGLGLAICQALLEAMDSRLQVDTSPESGTRFSFRLALPAV